MKTPFTVGPVQVVSIDTNANIIGMFYHLPPQEDFSLIEVRNKVNKTFVNTVNYLIDQDLIPKNRYFLCTGVLVKKDTPPDEKQSI